MSDVTDSPGHLDRRGLPPGRRVVLEGCVNFRDLGGYATADGRRTRWRRLYRADGLSRLSPADLTTLTDLGLATVIDLRTRDEAEVRGSFPVDEVPVAYHGLPLMDLLPTEAELPDWHESSYVASRYLEMVTASGGTLAAAIEVLAGSGALPAVVHCSAGKDRTGVLAALLLAFLGVPDATIVEDYALSGPAMVRLIERLKAEYPESVEAVTRFAPAILNVAPETMVELLASVRAEFGSYRGLADALGVGEAVDRLGAALLEPA
jgi:protein-tyrosine phosphatase